MNKRIFVAYDGSTCSVKALDEAILLARTLSATLCIAHVDEDRGLHGGMDIQAYVDRVGKVKKIHNQLEKMLDEAVTRASAAGCQVEREMIAANHRRPAEAIADAARDWKADLIIVGTHGRKGFHRLLVGSVAEQLVRVAEISLMLVREPPSSARKQ
jgi:nucleotide-binding universal stress UspA family protein